MWKNGNLNIPLKNCKSCFKKYKIVSYTKQVVIFNNMVTDMNFNTQTNIIYLKIM